MVDIVYCCNSAWLDYVKVSVKSIRKHNKANIYIVTDSTEKVNGCTMIPLPDMSAIKEGKGRHFTQYTFIRLFLADILPLEKVLYLDVDTICVGSLEELWKMEPRCIAAVHEKQYNGINSGVMLLNLKEFGKHKHELIEDINRNSYPYPDQDAINHICEIECIENKWNYCVNNHATGECNDPRIIHYIISKPWNGRCELSGVWDECAKNIIKHKERNMDKVIYNGKECEVLEQHGSDVIVKVDGEVRYVAGNLLGKAEPKAEPKKTSKKATAKK